MRSSPGLYIRKSFGKVKSTTSARAKPQSNVTATANPMESTCNLSRKSIRRTAKATEASILGGTAPEAGEEGSCLFSDVLVTCPEPLLLEEPPSPDTGCSLNPGYLKRSGSVSTCISLLEVMGEAPLPAIKVATTALISVITRIQVSCGLAQILLCPILTLNLSI
jgi:hypothetical protein